jgi:hypothetical protein
MYLRRQEQEQRRQHRRRRDGLENHFARLPTHLCQHLTVINVLFAIIHVAQTAQRKTNSGFFTELEDPRHTAVEQWEHKQPPPAIYIACDQYNPKYHCNYERCNTPVQASLPLFRADVGNANIRRNHVAQECFLFM